MYKYYLIFYLILYTHCFSQNTEEISHYNQAVDTLNLTVDNIFLSGNQTTEDEIILREMSLKRGSKFTLKKYTNDLQRIYNLGLFTKVDILPFPSRDKSVLLNVDVQERWYIIPLPEAGIDDGEWSKKWIGMKIRWDNFRGRNETISLQFRLLYNPSINLSYNVPWIGKKLHLYSILGGGYSRIRNQSLNVLGKTSGGETIKYSESNYDNIFSRAFIILGKYFTQNFHIFTETAFNYLRVSEFQPGRTLSADGKDMYLTLGLGTGFDSRDIFEYPTKGFYMKTSYNYHGLIEKEINFSRYNLAVQTYIPMYINKNYYFTAASRIYSSLAIGPVIPYYNHVYLGYSNEYIRGWEGTAFEGEDIFTMYNELRFPIIFPKYVKADKLPLLKTIPVINKMDLKYGVYFTLFYDLGTVWFRTQSIEKLHLMNGAGLGLNFILPFGYVIRTEWAFPIKKPSVGQFIFSASLKI